MKILKEEKESSQKALDTPGWLGHVQRKLNSMKKEVKAEMSETESLEEDASELNTSVQPSGDFEEGTIFRVNDTNRSIYEIYSISTYPDGEDWAVFGSRHTHATPYAAKISDLQNALDEKRIKIQSDEEIKNWRLRGDNKNI